MREAISGAAVVAASTSSQSPCPLFPVRRVGPRTRAASGIGPSPNQHAPLPKLKGTLSPARPCAATLPVAPGKSPPDPRAQTT
jgi:hypothetical protein